MQLTENRPDIDGLRAIAVLSVVFFHIGFEPFSGGYVGVDIFFVISGFLITRKITKGILEGTFTIPGFYAGRVRRLFPALFFTLATTLIAGYFIFTPEHFDRLGESVLYAIASVSNFFFWMEAGYFDAEASIKPLIHTWSLAIEEQFYLVWPLALILLLRSKRESFVVLFLLVIGISSLYFTQTWLVSDAEGAFYLTPFRVVEFAIGALCVWLVRYTFRIPLIKEILVVVGTLMIAFPITTYSQNTVFPGINALLPCIGTAILIYSGNAPVMGRIFRNPLLVGIGLISYSLYLIHWPIIVFYKNWKFLPLDIYEKNAIIAASIVTAFLMYRYVEKPFWRRSQVPTLSKSNIFIPACIGLVVMLVIPAIHITTNGGYGWRIPEEVRNVVQIIENNRKDITKGRRSLLDNRLKQDFPKINSVNGVLIGDSYGVDIFNAIEQNQPTINLTFLKTDIICQPYVGPRRVGLQDIKSEQIAQDCEKQFDDILSHKYLASADIILIASAWRDHGAENLGKTIDAIKLRSKAKIIIFGNKIDYNKPFPDLVVKFGRLNGLYEFVNKFRGLKGHRRIKKKLTEQISGKDILFVDIADIICPDEFCPVFTPEMNLMRFDGGHWTFAGTKYFGKLFKSTGSPASKLIFE